MRKLKQFLLLTMLIVATVALSACGKTTVDLNKYITINTSGYDSMGKADYQFDYEAFEKDFKDKIKLNTKDNKELEVMLKLPGMSASKLMLDTCVVHTLDKRNGLSNGDKINLEWTNNDELADKTFNTTLKYSNIEHEVTGLTEVGKFDPFLYVEMTYSGIAPEGSAIVKTDLNQEEMQYIYFNLDKNNNLKNGDTITVTAQISGSTEEFVEKFGKVLGTTEKSFTVENLPFYTKKVEDISEDLMTKMVSQGEDAFRAYVARKWAKPENLISIKLAGNYFLTPKDDMNTHNHNQLYLIYQIQAKNPDPEKVFDYYYYVRFADIINMGDGTSSVDLSGYLLPNTDWSVSEYFEVGNYRYIGYEKLESLFSNTVVTKIDNFSYTTTFK